MQNRLGTLFFLLSLFVATSSGRALACGNEDTDHALKFHKAASESSCCSKNEAQTSSVDESEPQHAGSTCPCDHENGSCHCPDCGIFCHFSAAFALEVPLALAVSKLNASLQKQAFYFAEHRPEAVYLPIWQPPKIGA